MFLGRRRNSKEFDRFIQGILSLPRYLPKKFNQKKKNLKSEATSAGSVKLQFSTDFLNWVSVDCGSQP